MTNNKARWGKIRAFSPYLVALLIVCIVIYIFNQMPIRREENYVITSNRLR